ncbi:hypothetical protein AGMMS49965_15280 [Bacteroidia bacterium]|nr:hypothetical protein AGMMS49965_15280 [Bacteroidia bacterium]
MSAQTDIWVSPTGSGAAFSQAAPGSLTEVYDKISELRGGGGAHHIVVQLLPGEYALEQPLTVGADIAGSPTDTLRFVGSHEGKAIITGGKRASDWTSHGSGIYKTQLPAGTDFRQLYVNGKMAIRARTPNREEDTNYGPYWRIRTLTNFPAEAPDSVRMLIDTAQFRPWSNMGDVEIVLNQQWCQSRIKIAATELSGRNIAITGSLFTTPFGSSNVPYYWENSLDFLDAEGEWYFDRQTGWLYYKPRTAENINGVEVMYPSAEKLLSIAGSAGAHVQNVWVQNVEFAYSNWTAPNVRGFTSTTGASPRLQTIAQNEMIGIIYADHVRLLNCNIFCAGDNGLSLRRGTKNAEIVGCHFDQMAANAITIEGQAYPAPTDSCVNHRIAHNLMENVGTNYTSAFGMFTNNTTNMVVENNEIRYGRYGGMHIGGPDVENSALRGNLIRHNDTHHLMWVHNDCGGIYTISRQPGTQIYRNWIHDLRANKWHMGTVDGIFLDNWSAYILVADNVITGTSAIQQNVSGIAAHDNTFRNNVQHDPLIEAATGPEMYTGVITTAAGSANLASLVVNSSELASVFEASTPTYSVFVSHSTDSVYVAAVAEDPQAVVSGDVRRNLPLGDGNNTFTINVLARDGVSTKTYTLTVVRAATTADSGTDADLLSLTINGQPASYRPSFSVTIEVGEGVSEAVLQYTKSPYSRLFVNYEPQAQQGQAPYAEGSVTIPLLDSITTLRLEVRAEIGTAFRSYPLTLIKAPVPTSVKAINYSPLRVHPNPTSGELVIEGDEVQANDAVEIYNMAGTLVETGRTPFLHMGHLPTGVYIVKVGNRTAKVVKK